MKKIDTIHEEAMKLAQQAFLAQKNGNDNDFIKLTEKSFILEKQAAMLLKDKIESEPNRSILFKSAAFLANDLKKYDECKNLIIYALLGEPEQGIKDELFDLFSEISEMNPKTMLLHAIQYNISIVNPKDTFSNVYLTNSEMEIDKYIQKITTKKSLLTIQE